MNKHVWIVPLIAALIFAVWGIIDELHGINCRDQVWGAAGFSITSCVFAWRSRQTVNVIMQHNSATGRP